MATGDVMNFTLAHNVNATTAYVNNVFIEGVAQTEELGWWFCSIRWWWIWS